jgi:hypothetical protein
MFCDTGKWCWVTGLKQERADSANKCCDCSVYLPNRTTRTKESDIIALRNRENPIWATIFIARDALAELIDERFC